MSALHTMAEGIQAVLEGVAAIAAAEVDVFVDRQANVVARISAATKMARGNAVRVFFEGYSSPEGYPKNRVRASYTITTYSQAILVDANKTPAARLYADDLIEIIHKALQHYSPPIDGKAIPNMIGEMAVSGGDLVPDPRWLSYELTVAVDVQL